MNTIKKTIPIVFALLPVLAPYAFAQQVEVNSVADIKSKVLCPIVTVMFWAFMIVAVIMGIWSAFLYLTSGGDSEKVKTATKSLTYAAIAIVVAILANSFPLIVGSIFRLSGTPITGCPTS